MCKAYSQNVYIWSWYGLNQFITPLDGEKVQHPISSRFSDNGQGDIYSPFLPNNSMHDTENRLLQGGKIIGSKVRTAGNSPAMSPGMLNLIINTLL
jgi:hypothetical protein